ncbi:MAG: hypothetical protein AAGE52_32485 [Myxococcota bacterium]
MARGESETRQERTSGLAIWAVFGVACLAAALMVVWATATPDEDPYVVATQEPFPGAEAAMSPLMWRGCLRAGGPALPGPHVPEPELASRLHDDLAARGYEAVGEWKDVALPYTGMDDRLDGGCGVIAAIGEPGSVLSGAGARDASGAFAAWTPCHPEVTTVGVCGTTDVQLGGTGLARIRVYVFPGLTERDARATTMPAEAVLAHAEAETLLSRVGWRGSEMLVEVTMPPSLTSRPVSPPPAPTADCVPWVAVGVGVGPSQVTWLGRNVYWGTTAERFLTGVITCGGSHGTRHSELLVGDANDGGSVWYRPYDATRAGPVVGARRATEIGLARPSTGPLPDAVEDRLDD